MDYFFGSFLAATRLILSFDAELTIIVITSLKVACASAFFAACAGVPLGLLVAIRDFYGKRVVRVLLNTLMATPTVVVGLIFYGLLSRKGALGEWELLFTPLGMVAALTVLAIPITANLTFAAIKSQDKRLFITCKLIGATPFIQALLILRESRMGVMAAVVTAFGRVVSEVGIAMMIGGNIKGYTRTMTTAIALETSKGEFELGLALGVVLLSIALIVNLALFALQGGGK